MSRHPGHPRGQCSRFRPSFLYPGVFPMSDSLSWLRDVHPLLAEYGRQI